MAARKKQDQDTTSRSTAKASARGAAAKPRETGTAGQSAEEQSPARTLPPDPQDLGRPMTPDEQVDESSLESMDGSDPPSYMPSHTGGPKRAEGEIDEEQVRQRAYALWDEEGRPSGRDDEYWHRAERELRELRQKQR